MSASRYEFHVNGLSTDEGRIPVFVLMRLLGDITESAGKSLRLAIEGTSTKAGRPPGWLDEALNFTVTGIGPGCTMIALEAPTLGEVLHEEFAQEELFAGRPNADDTALSLFARSLQDTTAEDMESDFYDAGVLRSLLDFRKLFRGLATSIEIRSPDRPRDEVTFGAEVIDKVERLRQRLPEVRAFVVSGKLDSIHHSARRFWLELPDGQKIPGRVDEEFLSAEVLRGLWGHKATIKGMVHFRPSGRVQLLEAQTLAPAEMGDEIFSTLPRVEEMPLPFETGRVDSAMMAHVRGKWPGDESIDELLEALRNN